MSAAASKSEGVGAAEWYDYTVDADYSASEAVGQSRAGDGGSVAGVAVYSE